MICYFLGTILGAIIMYALIIGYMNRDRIKVFVDEMNDNIRKDKENLEKSYYDKD